MLDSRPRVRASPCHCVVSLSRNIKSSLVLVQPRKTRPFLTERLLMGVKNQIKQTKQTSLNIELQVKLKNCYLRENITVLLEKNDIRDWDQSNDNGAVI